MSYIGNTLENQNYVPAIDYFNGDGATVAFTLSRPVASVAAVQAVISNVPQNPGSAFSVSGSTITFTSAPPSGTNNIYIYYTSPNTQVVTLPQSPTILGTTTFGNSLSYGASGLLASFASNTNGYNQVVLQNASSGASASSDLIVSNNSGTDSTNYGDFGINGSGFSGSGAFSDASGVYMYAQTGTMAVGTVGAQSLKLATNNTVQATINSSGNVGINTTTPNSKLNIDLGGVSTLGQQSNEGLAITGGGSNGNYCQIGLGYGTGTTYTPTAIGAVTTAQTGYTTADLVFATRSATTDTAPTERMRIDSNGNVGIGGAIAYGIDLYGPVGFHPVGTAARTLFYPSEAYGYLWSLQIGTNGNSAWRFTNSGGTQVGYITVNSGGTVYSTTSDYRLKENIQPMQDALATVAKLNPVTYVWKEDGSEGQGFIAHELQAVVPDCVTGEKDAVDVDGNPTYQGIDTSYLVATLTAAIQELNAKVDAQAAEIAALKGAA